MTAYPCKFCGTPVHGNHDGRGFKMGKFRFVTCTKHAAHVETVADVTMRLTRAGVRTLLAKKSPTLLALVDQAVDERRRDEQRPPINVGVL
jgi:hypothetical protein